MSLSYSGLYIPFPNVLNTYMGVYWSETCNAPSIFVILSCSSLGRLIELLLIL